jgi:hypothetical protein
MATVASTEPATPFGSGPPAAPRYEANVNNGPGIAWTAA